MVALAWFAVGRNIAAVIRAMVGISHWARAMVSMRMLRRVLRCLMLVLQLRTKWPAHD
jgi:hypothetical protein